MQRPSRTGFAAAAWRTVRQDDTLRQPPETRVLAEEYGTAAASDSVAYPHQSGSS